MKQLITVNRSVSKRKKQYKTRKKWQLPCTAS